LKDGIQIQRWLCRNCGYRFSENSLNNCLTKNKCDAHGKKVLAVEVEGAEEKSGLNAGATEQTTQQADVKGKIIEYCFHMQKQGYSEATVRLHRTALKVLVERGSNLFAPESVKEVLARQGWSENRRRNVINAYDSFVKYIGLSWEKPYCKARTQQIPYIPSEMELDALIAGSNRKLACFLQMLKETAMRAGEAKG
jgi:hypothetical protein